ncbi:hypothetical protein N7468_003756 [Penicillium chermesinum]|uniref:DUF8035 domain-containing protein n=1 Tax=Penicillium chermesinum TaxID=63820 RepID=A0A9W9TS33_9EURO|nr:uncharacterized protein N7468_003756 [Penicillium chermesinum]KAJ5239137.1 hypothetical protein N7468_003756 [Penicillium chermesinum]
MDASTSATIAALVVAILAMIVAMLQAAQQYIVTGQLIRLCDSVVFGKMPGQGRRVWQMHQFRFRIVYSIPQVSLRRDLWPETLPHIPSYAKGSRSLPDLGFLGLTQGFELEAANGGSQSVLVSAGEASWVSFCRAAQLSSGHSMVLDLVQGDADRCPPDLPNVPIQMSMRDIATLGLMTGMKCTQASFDGKSLSMQGAIGTITTSQHPSLGPLLHFSPRNMSIAEIRELTVGTGDISPFWMARMWDEVVVAGRRYTRKDRVQVEREEAFWADRPRERALVPATRNCSPPPDSLYGLRRRVSVRSSMTTNSVSNQPTDIKPSPTGLFGSQSLCREGRPLWTRSDGDWHLDNSPPGPRVVSLNQAPAGSEKQEMGTTSNMNMKIKWRLWNNRLRSFIRQDNSSVSDKHHDPFVAEIESGTSHDGEIGISQIAMSSSTARSDHIRVNKHMHPMDKGAELQPRWLIRDYINQKQKDLTVLHDDELTRDGPRLIEWYNEEELEIPELNGAQRKIANAVLDVWAGAAYDLGEHRPAFYARRWRFIVQQRQAERERRPISRSRTIDQGSHVRSRPPSRKDVEYGDTVVSPNSRINERIALHSESKSPVSPDSDHSHPQSRVGFDHAIQVFQTSSDEEEELEDESSHISPVGHGVRSEKWPAEESSFHANSIPPSKGIPKGILRPPRESFPEDPNPIREGVAPLKDAKLDGIPSGARWTRIDRKLVSPEVLEMGNERFEVTPSSVIVLRVLTKQEVQRYAALTHRMQVLLGAIISSTMSELWILSGVHPLS